METMTLSLIARVRSATAQRGLVATLDNFQCQYDPARALCSHVLNVALYRRLAWHRCQCECGGADVRLLTWNSLWISSIAGVLKISSRTATDFCAAGRRT